ncbi:SDR family oxidoreductase [Tropicimonas marinistellae]|uniref:SDR family oxidoreductase n=1 Tax=Tropicimonas marinistellae TaxID=1739787 RepID=UPI00082AB154|nr:SDR family oxidoreductase [Tropicimonas marinistellae]
MPTVLITGANRGIGLEFARQYAADGWEVLAANRTPFKPMDIVELGPGARELRYDGLNEASVADVATRLRGHAIDVAIMNAGIDDGKELAPEEIDEAHWQRMMLTNTWAPFRLATLIEENLKAGEKKTLVEISSLAASNGTYAGKRHFTYRASKAALNQLWRSLAMEWKPWGCICLALRPGREQTRMLDNAGGPTPEESVSAMRQVVENATSEQSGMHINYDGTSVPW